MFKQILSYILQIKSSTVNFYNLIKKWTEDLALACIINETSIKSCVHIIEYAEQERILGIRLRNIKYIPCKNEKQNSR